MCEWPMLNDYFLPLKFSRKEPRMFHQQQAAAGHRAPAEDNYFSAQKPFDFYFSLHHQPSSSSDPAVFTTRFIFYFSGPE